MPPLYSSLVLAVVLIFEYILSQNDPEKFNTNCCVSQTYFVASELRPTVVFKFV